MCTEKKDELYYAVIPAAAQPILHINLAGKIFHLMVKKIWQ